MATPPRRSAPTTAPREQQTQRLAPPSAPPCCGKTNSISQRPEEKQEDKEPEQLGEDFMRHLRLLASRLLALGKLETIAGSAHGFQVARIFRIDLDLLTDAAHIHVHRARGDKAGVAPNGVQQVVAA